MSDEPRAQRTGQPLANEVEAPEPRLPVRVLGRSIGTADGWDQVGDDSNCFYQFVPSPGIDLAEGDLIVNYLDGQFEYYADDGTIRDTRDIIAIVERLPRS